MFKKPFAVNIAIPDTVEVQHDIKVSPMTMYQTQQLVKSTEESAIRTVLVGAAAIATSQILVHIVKTKIS